MPQARASKGAGTGRPALSAERALAANREHSKGDGNFPRARPDRMKVAAPVRAEKAEPTASRARPHKPPARELSKRKAAALATGGGKLPPRVRKELDRKPVPRRTERTAAATSLRTGSRRPKSARWVRAVEASQRS